MLVLGVTGWGTRPLMTPTWERIRAAEPSLQVQSLEGSLGEGLTFGVFGGFRSVIADFLWLDAYGYWEQQDLPQTQKLIDVVTTVDPRPLYFWINGARIIAYDMPQWRLDAARESLSESDVRRIDREQSRAALDLLERGLAVHPGNPFLLIEVANIHLRRLGEVAAAADYYRQAAEAPGAPFYAARIHAVLLEQLGRLQDAYDWLCRLYPTLPADNPLADVDYVLQRIRRLEDRLNVPPSRRFHPKGP